MDSRHQAAGGNKDSVGVKRGRKGSKDPVTRSRPSSYDAVSVHAPPLSGPATKFYVRLADKGAQWRVRQTPGLSLHSQPCKKLPPH